MTLSKVECIIVGMNTKRVCLVVYLNEDLRKQFHIILTSQGLKMSTFLVKMIEEYVNRNGGTYLKKG